MFVDVTELRRLETLRRDFVANVSHELRTPVAAISSAAETLESAITRDPEAAKDFVQMILRNAERLRNLVDDLLDLSRIESQDFAVRLEPVDAEELAGAVLDLFRERATKKRIQLVSDVHAPKCRAGRSPGARARAHEPRRQRGEVLRPRQHDHGPHPRGGREPEHRGRR